MGPAAGGCVVKATNGIDILVQHSQPLPGNEDQPTLKRNCVALFSPLLSYRCTNVTELRGLPAEGGKYVKDTAGFWPYGRTKSHAHFLKPDSGQPQPPARLWP